MKTPRVVIRDDALPRMRRRRVPRQALPHLPRARRSREDFNRKARAARAAAGAGAGSPTRCSAPTGAKLRQLWQEAGPSDRRR
ncbi:MAG: hypothetical protein MZV70_46835 [Desulfobacterales bacterium]|nr:hypothetical protein [Desulfobacterales bacterium]